MDSEDKLQMIMTHIKNNDLDFVSFNSPSNFAVGTPNCELGA